MTYDWHMRWDYIDLGLEKVTYVTDTDYAVYSLVTMNLALVESSQDCCRRPSCDGDQRLSQIASYTSSSASEMRWRCFPRKTYTFCRTLSLLACRCAYAFLCLFLFLSSSLLLNGCLEIL